VVTQFVYRFYTLGRLDDLHPEPPSDIDNSLSLARIREDNGKVVFQRSKQISQYLDFITCNQPDSRF